MINNSKNSTTQPVSKNNSTKEIRNGSSYKDNSSLEALLKKTK